MMVTYYGWISCLGINGFMHMIEDVLIYEPDLRAHSGFVEVLSWQLMLVLLFMFLRPGAVG